MIRCYETGHGCILGDEMGLGKTCQTICLLVFLSGKLHKRPFMIICPLSVLNNWRDELKSFNWTCLVVDEAQRLKNQDSLLHKTLSEPLLLRRVKAEVSEEIPKKVEVVLYHGMSALQKKLYKALLVKDLDAFENESGKKANLQNVLIQLRKCVAHPYLFIGVEPEPFVVGDHLIEASGKLNLLDKLLSFLYVGKHRVLLFSQMTQMLDILQDYMDYKGYSYERLDGSVRGGVGINLTAADTVIFVDSDFNPQNDVQAAARAHRIGQKKPVKIIRLIGRDTVEEIIYRRAIAKLQLTNTVIEGGQFALGAHKTRDISDVQKKLHEILKFGLDKLLSSEGSTVCDIDLRNILGETKGGIWSMDPVQSITEINEEHILESHMYIFEGKDYSKETSQGDKKAYDHLLEHQKALLEDLSQGGRILRNKENVLLMTADMGPSKKRKLSPEELEVQQKRIQEAAAKKARLREEKRQRAAEIEQQKNLWEANHYQSCCLESEENSEEEDEEEEKSQLDLEYTDPEKTSIKYIVGDVTHPIVGDEDAIIVHCVDDSGHWGRGGLFTALGNRSDQPKKIYELAGKMKDLALGGTLLFCIDDKESRNKGTDLLALIVAQHRDHSNNLSGIKLPALEKGLKKIYQEAKKRNASIHLPRIGYSFKGFNWYGTERLIRKYLGSRGIPTYATFGGIRGIPFQQAFSPCHAMAPSG
ncbi:hypothetical protein E2320_017134 [Naja naja]|nr:hypothetical protein E2320_017134 [Naja naja]